MPNIQTVKKTKIPGGKVVGVRHWYGEMGGNPFDVYHVYVSNPAERREGFEEFGSCPSFVKVKADLLHQVVAADKIDKLIGRFITFLYDSYDNVAVVNVQKNDQG